MFYHLAYGLTIKSDIELAEVPAWLPCEPDIIVRFGQVEDLQKASFISDEFAESRNAFFVVVKGVACFRVANGMEVVVQPFVKAGELDPASSQLRDIRLYLMGSVLGICLMQRSILPMHVSALFADDSAIAFTGPSGAGKSTTAAALASILGWQLLADDVARFELLPDRCVIYPGAQRLRLKADALQHLDLGEGFEKVANGAGRVKFQRSCLASGGQHSAVLGALVILGVAGESQAPRLSRLHGAEAFQVCRAAMYRPFFAKRLLPPAVKMALLSGIARSVPVFLWERSFQLSAMNENIDALLQGLAEAEIIMPPSDDTAEDSKA